MALADFLASLDKLVEQAQSAFAAADSEDALEDVRPQGEAGEQQQLLLGLPCSSGGWHSIHKHISDIYLFKIMEAIFSFGCCTDCR